MMKRRLQSILHPHRRSKCSVAMALMLTVALCVGAAYVGGYPEAPTASEALIVPPLEEPLKPKLGGVSGIVGSDENLYSSFELGGRTVIHRGYYGDGYILHLKYDSSAERAEGDLAVLTEPNVVVPEALRDYADDAGFAPILGNAAASFLKANAHSQISDGFLTLVAVHGPYEESPDALLDRFYHEKKLSFFVAVMESGQTSAARRRELTDAAVEDGDVAALSILLGAGISAEDADALLVVAYDDGNLAVFHLLLDCAGAEAQQDLLVRAARDGQPAFLAAIDEAPSEETIDAMIDGPGPLAPPILALISNFLTGEQALRIAEEAYGRGDVAAFSIVVDELDDEDKRAFHERAYRERNMAFLGLVEE